MSFVLRKILAEFLGTFILMFIGGLSILSAVAVGGEAGPVVIAFGWGFALLAGLYAMGEVSGGHFNPAVTLAALFDNRVDFPTLIFYWVAQFAGAVIAAVVLVYASSTTAVAGMTTVPGAGVGAGSAFLLEVALTAVFVMVILKVTTSKEFGASALAAISLTLVGLTFAAYPLTGASVNPARTLAPAIVGTTGTDIWVYMFAPLLGAIVGWGLYRLVTTGEADIAVDEPID